MKKIITVVMIVCMILSISLAAPVTFNDVALEDDISSPISTSEKSPFDEVIKYNQDSSVSDINNMLNDLGSVSVGIIRSPMRIIIAIIRVVLTLLPLVLFLITFIYAIRWLINNKKDKEAEKTKKLQKKAIGFAIATAVSFVLYIGFSVIIIPLTMMSMMF